MTKDSIDEWDTTPGNNADIGGINIAENCAAANINNAIREQMAQLATFYATLGTASTGDIGTDVQAYSANLDEYAAVNPTAAGLALLDDADAEAQRTTLGIDAAIAAYLAGLGPDDVGFVGMLRNESGASFSEGATVSGANLRYASADGFVGTATIPTGTWQCCGYAASNASGIGDRTTTWRKVSA